MSPGKKKKKYNNNNNNNFRKSCRRIKKDGVTPNLCRRSDGFWTSANVGHLAKRPKTENPLRQRLGASRAPLLTY